MATSGEQLEALKLLDYTTLLTQDGADFDVLRFFNGNTEPLDPDPPFGWP